MGLFSSKAEQLLQAASRGDTAKVEKLLQKGCELTCEDGRGRTPLVVAALAGHLETTELLLTKGAAVTSLVTEHAWPILMAIAGRRPDLIGRETVVAVIARLLVPSNGPGIDGREAPAAIVDVLDAVAGSGIERCTLVLEELTRLFYSGAEGKDGHISMSHLERVSLSQDSFVSYCKREMNYNACYRVGDVIRSIACRHAALTPVIIDRLVSLLIDPELENRSYYPVHPAIADAMAEVISAQPQQIPPSLFARLGQWLVQAGKSKPDACHVIGRLIRVHPASLGPEVVENLRRAIPQGYSSDGDRPVGALAEAAASRPDLVRPEDLALMLKSIGKYDEVCRFHATAALAAAVVRGPAAFVASVDLARSVSKRLADGVKHVMMEKKEARVLAASLGAIARECPAAIDADEVAALVEMTERAELSAAAHKMVMDTLAVLGKKRPELVSAKMVDEAAANLRDAEVKRASDLVDAAGDGALTAVKELLDDGVSANATEPEAGMTPLFTAAFKGHDEVVSLLLDRGADVNGVGYKGCTPLMSAAMGGHLAIAKLLLARGAQVASRDEDGHSAAWWAATKGQSQVEAFLRQLASAQPSG